MNKEKLELNFIEIQIRSMLQQGNQELESQ
jgi:hypothetical protein